MSKAEDSLEELMAQFRELEHSDPGSSSHGKHGEDGSSNIHMDSSSIYKSSAGALSWKWIGSSWYPLVILFGGLFFFIVLLVSIFRPKFLYTSDQLFLWKRYFITIFVTYFLLLGTLWGLHIYTNKFF